MVRLLAERYDTKFNVSWVGFDFSYKRPTCLATLKSGDTTKQSVYGWQYIHLFLREEILESAHLEDIQLDFSWERSGAFPYTSVKLLLEREPSGRQLLLTWYDISLPQGVRLQYSHFHSDLEW